MSLFARAVSDAQRDIPMMLSPEPVEPDDLRERESLHLTIAG
jgi:hypothetical protein